MLAEAISANRFMLASSCAACGHRPAAREVERAALSAYEIPGKGWRPLA
jgi:hypothetical protein